MVLPLSSRVHVVILSADFWLLTQTCIIGLFCIKLLPFLVALWSSSSCPEAIACIFAQSRPVVPPVTALVSAQRVLAAWRVPTRRVPRLLAYAAVNYTRMWTPLCTSPSGGDGRLRTFAALQESHGCNAQPGCFFWEVRRCEVIIYGNDLSDVAEELGRKTLAVVCYKYVWRTIVEHPSLHGCWPLWLWRVSSPARSLSSYWIGQRWQGGTHSFVECWRTPRECQYILRSVLQVQGKVRVSRCSCGDWFSVRAVQALSHRSVPVDC